MSKTAVAHLLDASRPQFVYGCDYNPEQWTPDVWLEDARLMREAGVNLVAINIFGWAQLEPLPGQFSFDALDAVIEVLHSHGIGINLGTGTSSPPPWLSAQHPEVLPTMSDGTRRAFGGRQAYCPSSPVYREYSIRLVEEVARRYGSHPAIKAWHVANELGCHNSHCFCEESSRSFRNWLIARYETLDALNDAWGTSFWSQRYADWNHIFAPQLTVSTGNPGQALDFARFSSDELLGQYEREAEVVRRHSTLPVTTNFMVAAHIRNLDYWAWAPQMDFIANDHYLDHRLTDPRSELSFSADVTRGLAQGNPWMLMEQATSAVNWQPVNIAKGPGEMIRNSLTHVARGADGISFFQWRASVQGSEKFHSALLPHAGQDSSVWRDSVRLGGILAGLSDVTGSRVVADIALVFGWQAWWATDLDSHPSGEVKYLEQVHASYNALLAAGYTVDIVAPGADLSGYRLVVVPALYSVSDADAAVLESYVAGGGHAVVTFFGGIVDEHDRVRTGGYPGAFRSMLGISIEEFFPLAAEQLVALDNGSTAQLWTEKLHLTGAEAINTFATGPLPGVPAITRNTFGAGSAWYLATSLDADALGTILVRAANEAGVVPPERNIPGVEVVKRASGTDSFLFVINHTDVDISYPATGTDLLDGATIDGEFAVPAGEVGIVRLVRASTLRDAAHTKPTLHQQALNNEVRESL